MICAINYANSIFTMSAKYNLITARVFGKVDKTISYTPQDIDKGFYNRNKDILSLPRGNGYWLWKPYFIKKELNQLNTGDYLVYSDSGTVYIRDIKYVINRMKQDIYLGNVDGNEREYTKRDAFIVLNADKDEIKNTKQFEATFIIIRKSAYSVNFVDEWLSACQYEDLITDAASKLDKDELGFIEHRHDQSLLSIIAKKHDIEPHLGLSDPDRDKQIKKLLNAYQSGDLEYINGLKKKFFSEDKQTNCPRIFIHTRLKNTFIIKFVIKEFVFFLKTFYREVLAENLFYFLLKRI